MSVRPVHDSGSLNNPMKSNTSPRKTPAGHHTVDVDDIDPKSVDGNDTPRSAKVRSEGGEPSKGGDGGVESKSIPGDTCTQWRKAILTAATQLLLPLLDVGTDFYAAISMSQSVSCVTDSIKSLALKDQAPGHRFLQAIVSVLWITSVIGLLAAGFVITRVLRAVFARKMTLAEYDDDITAQRTAHGCNKWKVIKLSTLLCKDAAQFVCALLVSIYIKGYTGFAVVKVAVAVFIMARAFTRISVYFVPWKKLEGKAPSRCVWCGKATLSLLLFFSVATIILSPIWVSIASYISTAKNAHTAMRREDIEPAPTAYLTDAFAGLTEPRTLHFAVRLRACLDDKCTPFWASNYTGTVTTGKLPWDVMTHQVLMRSPADWSKYAVNPTGPASNASQTVVMAIRQRAGNNLKVTLIEGSGSEGLRWKSYPAFVPAADFPNHADLLAPNDSLRRITYDTFVCRTQNCWTNFTINATTLQKLNMPTSASMRIEYLNINYGSCED